MRAEVLLRTLRLQGAVLGGSATDPLAVAEDEPVCMVWLTATILKSCDWPSTRMLHHGSGLGLLY